MFDGIKREIKSTFLSLWKNKYWILVMCFILAGVSATVNYKINSKIAYSKMSLNYAEASYGLNPNSTRFSIYEFTTDKVMEEAIRLAGLEGKITPDELAKSIEIHQIDTKETNKEEYITTSYSIKYDGSNIDTENITAENMLDLICKAYKEYFMAKYGDNQSMLQNGLIYNHSTEPFLKLNSLSLRAEQLDRYIDERILENKSFKDENLDYTFTSLMKKIKNIINYDIPNIEAFILDSGVAENHEKLISTLEYKNFIEKMRYDTFKEYYNSDNTGIDMYDVAMSAIVMIPSENENDEYYMSRTQTAIDYLAKDADYNLKEATYSQKELTETDYMISQIKNSNGVIDSENENEKTAYEKTVSDKMDSALTHSEITRVFDEKSNKANIEKTDMMLSKLKKDLDDITEDLKVLDTSYIKYRSQDYLMFRNSTSSFLQNIGIKKIIIGEIGFLIICFIVLYLKVRKRKELNWNEKI